MLASDDLTADALRSDAPRVVVEAPAGCGKTWQGATYATDASRALRRGRVLVLAHTHAATDVFIRRTPKLRDRIEVRTIHSLIFEIAKAYHRSLGLPAEPAVWARTEAGGFDAVASRVAHLLSATPMVADMLAQRYPIVICDEHQDASVDQHALAMALNAAGAKVRIFGDPMQKLYGGKPSTKRLAEDHTQWETLVNSSTATALSHPHRWRDAPELGEWILRARDALKAGNAIDLKGDLPDAVHIVRAENVGQGQKYRLAPQDRKPVDAFVDIKGGLLIVCGQNETVHCVSSTFARRFPIWEGHTRDPLAALVTAVARDTGNAAALGAAACAFLQAVTTGFTPKGHSELLATEIATGCTAKRKGLKAGLQRLARRLLVAPDHRGVANLLADLLDLKAHDPAFHGIHVDYPTEFREAIALGDYDDADTALLEITRRRTQARPMPAPKAISTVHKAKGLEQENVLLLPCDVRHFSSTVPARHKLYVALSRATKELTLVIPTKDPSPLFSL